MNNKISTLETLRNAVKTYGETTQQVVAMEELAELQQAISKAMRGKLDKENLIEEIADVYIMILQLRMIYKIRSADISHVADYKIDRLKCNLEEVENEEI